MKTKEAIEWIFDIWHEWENVYGVDAEQNLKSGNEMDEVIALLKQGEKYRLMWEDYRECWKKYNMFYRREKKDAGYDIKYTMEEWEQKYFPKPKSKLIKLLAELDKSVKEVLEELGD